MAPRKKKNREEILQRKRELEKKRYQRLKNDKEKIDSLKQKKKEYYSEKKKEGKIKSINQETPRNQRTIRKQWRDNTAKYRARKKVIQNPNSDNDIINGDPTAADNRQVPVTNTPNEDKRADAGRKRALRIRRLRNNMLRHKDDMIKKLKAELAKYRKAISKFRNKRLKITPRKKVDDLIKVADTDEIKKRLLFSEVMKNQLSENFGRLKTQKERHVFTQAITGKIVKKYKVLSRDNIIPKKREHCTDTGSILEKNRRKRLEIRSIEIKNSIIKFLEEDSNSRMCSGKRETVTRHKDKRQKRYLLKPLKALHKLYVIQHEKVSYSLFCKYRPFWIIKPDVKHRDTCLCVQHANFELAVQGLFRHGIIKHSNVDMILEYLCCNKYSENCLNRKCKECKHNSIEYQEFDNDIPMSYFKWEYVHEEVFIKRTQCNRLVKKISKIKHTEKPYTVIMNFEATIPKFLNHHLNITHQYSEMKKCKENLTENDVLIHVDFSENYRTKYSSEVQANHFGGSRQQICMHTGVVYYNSEGQIKCQSFCTLSEVLDHDANAIWAHLQPIFDWISTNLKVVTNLHFLSDGPVTQYRNKFMFSILANRLKYFFQNIQKFTWNYSEAGHGKGAPDGIGAVCKRTADNMVALGEDTVDIKHLKNLLDSNCPNVKVYVIKDKDFEMAQIKLVGKPCLPFKGTLKVHQVVGTQKDFKLSMKKLSCYCNNMFSCEHYLLKTIDYASGFKKPDTQIYMTDSEDENSNMPQIDSQVPGPSNIVSSDDKAYKNGDYVLVRFKDGNNKTEYKYAGMCMGEVDEEGEIKVTFLKITSKDGKLFKMDENVYDVSIDDILKKLPQPTLFLKGERVFYKFAVAVEVFEK